MAFKQILEKKNKAKTLVLGADAVTDRTPLVCLVANQEYTDAVEALIDGLETLGVRLAVLGVTESRKSKTTHYDIAEKDALAAADIAIAFTADEVAQARKNGCVPVAPQNGSSTINYNPIQEKGNGFYFKQITSWDVFAAVVRALETYQFPYDWENVAKEAVK